MTDKRIIFYREAIDYYAQERLITFHTEPFLSGVGCGKGCHLDALVGGAQRAIGQGYRVILVSRKLPGDNKIYPLHNDDLSFLRDALKLTEPQ